MARINLLLVEDDPDTRSVIELALGLDNKIDVRSFESAEAAVKGIGEDELFDVALLDFHLPKMTGLDLHCHLRNAGKMPDLVTVLISAGVSDVEMAAINSANVAGLIPKPFDPLTLAHEIRGLLQSHRVPGATLRWICRIFGLPPSDRG